MYTRCCGKKKWREKRREFMDLWAMQRFSPTDIHTIPLKSREFLYSKSNNSLFTVSHRQARTFMEGEGRISSISFNSLFYLCCFPLHSFHSRGERINFATHIYTQCSERSTTFKIFVFFSCSLSSSYISSLSVGLCVGNEMFFFSSLSNVRIGALVRLFYLF